MDGKCPDMDPKEILWRDHKTVLSRTTAIFNTDVFSDVTFVVVESKEVSRRFHAHKLLLSLASPIFANLFKKSFTGRETIEVFDVTPRAFHGILKYLYTDTLNISDFEEAREIYLASVKYNLTDVQDKCKKYLCGAQEVKLDNVCKIFENACLINATEIKGKCYKLFEEHTQDIFQSSQFKNAERLTVETIIKQERMKIGSELEIIDAVLKWAKEECKRRGADPNVGNIRACASPFFKHIRFLSLPNDDFLKLVESTGILNAQEACRITWKLLKPDDENVQLPPGICPIASKRVYLSSEPSCKKFTFPLVSTRKQMSAQFNVDLKSIIHISMVRGQIKIIGVELQIQRKIFQMDSLVVFLKLTNTFSSYEEKHTVEVNGNPLKILFKKCLYVPAEQTASMDITVEELTISRCQSCDQLTFSNVVQSDVVFTVNVIGNHENDHGIVCLVKQFLYNSC